MNVGLLIAGSRQPDISYQKRSETVLIILCWSYKPPPHLSIPHHLASEID